MKGDWKRTLETLSVGEGAATYLARGLHGSPRVESVTPLQGGFANTNLRLDFAGEHPPVVLRFYQRDGSEAGKEKAIHLLAQARGWPVPHYLGGDTTNPFNGLPYALLVFVTGEPLETAVAEASPEAAKTLGRSAGETLAKIHRIHFERSGFLDESLQVASPVDFSAPALSNYLRDCLYEQGGASHLDSELALRLVTFFEAQQSLLDSWSPAPCLVHADFGGGNILSQAGKIVAVLDWEFALSGNLLFDFGNLLRPPLGNIEGFAEAAGEGYRTAGGSLPRHWQKMAAVLDLISWAQFLARPNVAADVVESARERILATLHCYG